MFKNQVLLVVWPAFLTACALEMVVFGMFDPQTAHWFGLSVELSRTEIYSISFFVFWALTALSSALTVYLTATHPKSDSSVNNSDAP